MMVEGLQSNGFRHALEFGNIIHDALDKLYTHAKETKVIKWDVMLNLVPEVMKGIEAEQIAKLNSLSVTPPSSHENLEEMLAVAEVLLEGYFLNYKRDYKKFNWVFLEKEFAVRFLPRISLGVDRDPIWVRGKWDGVFQTEGQFDHLWLFETKTKGRIEHDNILSKLHYDLQVMLYLWALRAQTGYTPRGVVYNILRRPMHERKKAESLPEFAQRIKKDIKSRPEHFFVRFDVRINLDDMKKWEEEFNRIMLFVIRWHDGDYRYKNSSACVDGLGPCEFLPICSRGDMSYYVKRETCFPELKGHE